jgi:predicted DNA-binding protein
MLDMQRQGVPMPEYEMTIPLDDDVVERLDSLARRTGRTPQSYATEAITRFLEDREDYEVAKDSHDTFMASGEKPLKLDDLDEESRP